MLSSQLLPCATCGAWAGSGPLCVGCGAGEGERVPLDESPGDGRWIVSVGGRPDVVLSLLDDLDPPNPREALTRIGAARRLVRALGDEDVWLVIDLRRPEVGHVARSKRRGSSEVIHYLLPWLVARTGSVEVRLLRYAYRKRQRTFASNRVNTEQVEYHLDELQVRTPAGCLRRPVRVLTSLATLDLDAVDPNVPGVDRPLPATAPGSPHGQGAPLAAGALVSATLAALVVVLALLAPAPRPAPEGWQELQAALTSGRATPTAVRAGLLASGVETRRQALVAARVLDSPERVRALRAAVADPDPEVRETALKQLKDREGELGAATLAGIYARTPRPAVRRQALRLLITLDDPRAHLLALQSLTGDIAGLEAGDRRLACQALGSLADKPAVRSDPRVAEALLDGLRDADPGVRAQAGFALTSSQIVTPARARPSLLLAFRRTLQETLVSPRPPLRAALLTLGSSCAAVGAGRQAFAEALAAPNLPGPLRRIFQRRLQLLLDDDR